MSTSTDGGKTWAEAPVNAKSDGIFVVTLPTVAPGTSVSLRSDATDAAGSRIEQNLFDAYRG